ncbi:MAG: (2Fe-2S)-binding protein, partial [Firmicutes bacterium]|nr:(2Fe-2S)-binding protein [Bacillota bacterium]
MKKAETEQKRFISLTVNGDDFEVEISACDRLIDVLRGKLGL